MYHFKLPCSCELHSGNHGWFNGFLNYQEKQGSERRSTLPEDTQQVTEPVPGPGFLSPSLAP